MGFFSTPLNCKKVTCISIKLWHSAMYTQIAVHFVVQHYYYQHQQHHHHCHVDQHGTKCNQTGLSSLVRSLFLCLSHETPLSTLLSSCSPSSIAILYDDIVFATHIHSPHHTAPHTITLLILFCKYSWWFYWQYFPCRIITGNPIPPAQPSLDAQSSVVIASSPFFWS